MRIPLAVIAAIFAALLFFPEACHAQVSYVARFTLDKQKFLLGEPIFCTYVIQNTGARTFSFRYRSPDRILNRDLENEPHFKVTAGNHRPLPDPAPKPCGGAKGSAVYGSVTLPPGKTHTERWLLNQWARISRPGRYDVRAERRLPLLNAERGEPEFTASPAAYAGAINEMQFEVITSSEAELRTAFQPYVKLLDAPPPADLAEPVLVMTTLPQPFFMEKLESLAHAPAGEHRWDPLQAIEGLARLGTPEAWRAIVKIARGETSSDSSPSEPAGPSKGDPFRAYAILLLAEKADRAYLPALLEMSTSATGDLRGDALRALGFFHDARANEVLFQKLHSSNATDRGNAILGLKNLNTKDSIPALLDMLKDPDGEVRQVANFALQGLTGQPFKLSPSAGPAEADRTAEQWHQWWQEHVAAFVPAHLPACHDW